MDRFDDLVSVNEIVGTSKAKVARTPTGGKSCLLCEINKVRLNVIVVVSVEILDTVRDGVVLPKNARNTFRSSRSSNTQNNILQWVAERQLNEIELSPEISVDVSKYDWLDVLDSGKIQQLCDSTSSLERPIISSEVASKSCSALSSVVVISAHYKSIF